jgi:hypothetical protein
MTKDRDVVDLESKSMVPTEVAKKFSMTILEVLRRVKATGEAAVLDFPIDCPVCDRQLKLGITKVTQGKGEVNVEPFHEAPPCDFSSSGALLKWIASAFTKSAS